MTQYISRVSTYIVMFFAFIRRHKVWAIVCMIGLLVWVYILTLPPAEYPVGSYFSIKRGTSVSSLSRQLYEQQIISHPKLFQTILFLSGGDRRVVPGDYLLPHTQNMFVLASRIARGSFGIEYTKVTIPEGLNVFQIADLIQKNIPNFNAEAFVEQARDKEGYLFSNTYYFSPFVTPEEVIRVMTAAFDKHVATLPALQKTEKPIDEVITMASIVEEEANNPEDKKIIAGILWKRLQAGMPLQVDATFSYVNGKNTYQLTHTDLKIDSPYNTYKYKGLPPGPIANPSVDAILATVYPTETRYWYFLTGKDGKMYYAKTFEEHVRNRGKM